MSRKKLKLPQEPQLAHIETLSHDGRGIAHLQGKTIFISGALAGEEVMFTYTNKRSRFDEGTTVEVRSPSPHRVTPQCAHFSICGGCSMQHMSAEQQIALKQQTLLEQFKHFAHCCPREIVPPLQGPLWGYRRKARLGVRYVDKKQKLLVGFREKSSRYLAELDSCEVLHPSVGQLITPLREFLVTLERFKEIPQIEVAIGDDITALVFRHLEALGAEDQLKLQHFAAQHQLQLYLQPGNYQTIHRIWPNDDNPWLSYQLPDHQLTLRFQPADFVQVNGEINRALVNCALAWLEPTRDDTILDLFCGLGNFSLPLARYAKQVIGVEGDEMMVQRAAENAAFNQIDNATFYAANLATSIANTTWTLSPFNKLLIDPPRTGALEVIAALSGFKHLERIVYVSCNPATLARDAGELVKQGYVLDKVRVVDMFPHTDHVESIALFTR